MLAIAIAAACAGFQCPVQALGESRVGRIIIEGNTDTPDRAILECLSFRPGSKLRSADLLAAQDRIRKCGFFPVNPWLGVGPTVQVLQNELDEVFLDIRIRVNERPGNWLRYDVREVLITAILGDRIVAGFSAMELVKDCHKHITGR
jgi:hypothetical protein